VVDVRVTAEAMREARPTTAAVTNDRGDDVVDGVIGDPFDCHFDPRSLIGTTTPCGTITAQDANVVAKIVAGPRTTNGDFLWYGLTWGAPFAGPITNRCDGLANTTTSGGKTIGVPFPLILQYLGTWVQRNPPVPAGTWDWTTTTFARFDQLFEQSVDMYGKVMGTDNPDLRPFEKSGGKLLARCRTRSDDRNCHRNATGLHVSECRPVRRTRSDHRCRVFRMPTPGRQSKRLRQRRTTMVSTTSPSTSFASAEDTLPFEHQASKRKGWREAE